MSQETSKQLEDNEPGDKPLKPGSGAADSGQAPAPVKKPVSASSTIRPRSTNTSVTRARSVRPLTPQKPRGHGIEIAMALVLGVLILVIAVVFIATSSNSPESKRSSELTAAPTSILQGQLTPKNAATADAVISQVANLDLSTKVALSPTPGGTPLNSTLDAQGANWPAAGADPARNRFSNTKLNFPLQKLWDAQVGGELQSSPAIANGLAFFGSSNGNFYAIDTTTGQTRWTRKYGAIASSPAVAGDKVYFGTISGFIYALDAATGQERWSFPTIEQVLSSPVVYNGTLYIGSNLGVFWAIDANTGVKRWSALVGNGNSGGISTSPAIANGMVYFGTNEGNFFAIDINKALTDPTHATVWKYQTPDQKGIFASPAIADGILYLPTESGKLLALKATDGSKVWEADLGGPSRSSPAIAGGMVYLGGSSKKVFAFDAKDGSKKWEFTTGEAVFSSPAIAEDTLVVGSNDTHLYALDRMTGTKIWDFVTDDVIGASPAVAGGKVYITSFDGRIYAFGQK